MYRLASRRLYNRRRGYTLCPERRCRLRGSQRPGDIPGVLGLRSGCRERPVATRALLRVWLFLGSKRERGEEHPRSWNAWFSRPTLSVPSTFYLAERFPAGTANVEFPESSRKCTKFHGVMPGVWPGIGAVSVSRDSLERLPIP